MTSSRLPLPTFIIIGAQKAGTRWLRSNLGRHPDIFTAEGEPSFFNRPGRLAKMGLDGYRASFDGWSGEAIVGESTPAYLMYHLDPDHVARRIDEAIEGVRLLAILRDPVERAQSALIHHIRAGRIESDARLVDLVERHPPGPHEQQRTGIAWGGPEALISGGWYGRSLKPYLERFGDRLLVLVNEDIAESGPEVYCAALGHVGASEDFVPDSLRRVAFSNRRHVDVPGLDIDERRLLWTFFADDVELLERLIDRDLDVWRSANGS